MKGRYSFLSNVKAYLVYLQQRADGGGTVIDLEMLENGNLVRKRDLQKLNYRKQEKKSSVSIPTQKLLGKSQMWSWVA